LHGIWGQVPNVQRIVPKDPKSIYWLTRTYGPEGPVRPRHFSLR
jgi:hypothetical protein